MTPESICRFLDANDYFFMDVIKDHDTTLYRFNVNGEIKVHCLKALVKIGETLETLNENQVQDYLHY